MSPFAGDVGNKLAKLLAATNQPFRLVGRKPTLRVAGWFRPEIAESYEMLCQNDSPNLFDSRKFVREFGSAGTPYGDGIRATVSSFSINATRPAP
jgi:hypothetical protein